MNIKRSWEARRKSPQESLRSAYFRKFGESVIYEVPCVIVDRGGL